MHHDEGVMLGRSGRASPGKGERQDGGPAAAGRRQGGGGQATLRADAVRGVQESGGAFPGLEEGGDDVQRPAASLPRALGFAGRGRPTARLQEPVVHAAHRRILHTASITCCTVQGCSEKPR